MQRSGLQYSQKLLTKRNDATEVVDPEAANGAARNEDVLWSHRALCQRRALMGRY